MIPALNPEQALAPKVQTFLGALRHSGFKGDIATDYANLLVNATDNSIYQLIPQAVIAPLSQDDIATAMALLAEHKDIALTPRGGGTGTNGQALNHTIVLDCSKHLRGILHFDAEAKEVTVEPGVILDQLNAFLKPYGLFFPPTLSPSNRATLGGMVATDACGKGSRIYGKTSDYITQLKLFLPSGGQWDMARYSNAEDAEKKEISTCLADIAKTFEADIAAKIPKLNREFSGYNLARIYDDEERFAPTNIIAGSEGTLGVIGAITFRLLPIPKHRRLVALCYRDFDTTLRAAEHLLSFAPLAAETFDGKVFQIARNDSVWHKVEAFMPEGADAKDVGGCNLVEFVGDDSKEVETLATQLMNDAGDAFHVAMAKDDADVAALWELRKKGVGLLGNMEGEKRPVPFAEDTAVPPEQLADYIAEYRAMLDAEGVDYGMFGHVDTGCLHVRPALNLRTPEDEAKVRRISDEVVQLVKRYGGLMWGEHGKGFRAEFTPEFIGQELYDCLRKIKAAFDPHNQLNPGKIATAQDTDLALYAIDGVPLRGHFEKDIQQEAIALFPKAVECNGNGACFNYAADDAMCPSYKVTGDRRYSPKGRAGLMREWLRQLNLSGYDIATGKQAANDDGAKGREDFSKAVYDSMQECLACKACAGQCPIKVDIPDLRARFLELYHTRYRRPLKDFFIRYSEELGALAAKAPRLFGAIQYLLPTGLLGLKDLPKPSAPPLAKFKIPELPDVVLIQDAYTSFYDARVVEALVMLMQKLGAKVQVADFSPAGKARHVKGYLDEFRTVAKAQDVRLCEHAKTGAKLVGVDAATTLIYAQEYKQMLDGSGEYEVLLPHQWLLSQIAEGKLDAWKGKLSGAFHLFSHCTEKTALPASPREWKQIFAHFGMQLEVVQTGCCGMAGTYGHETAHKKNSRALYEMSWQEPIIKAGDKALVTGFSCRCQVKRYEGAAPKHPAQALLTSLKTV